MKSVIELSKMTQNELITEIKTMSEEEVLALIQLNSELKMLNYELENLLLNM